MADERNLARRVMQNLPKEHAFRGKVYLEEVSWDDPGAPVPAGGPPEAPGSDLPGTAETVPMRPRGGRPLVAHGDAAPDRVPGKGKLERWHRTCRDQFLSELDDARIGDLTDLNARLWAWIEQVDHRTPHGGLGGLDGLT